MRDAARDESLNIADVVSREVRGLRGFRRLFAYNDWANRESLTSLAVIASPPERAMSFMGHVIGAEWLWLRRIHARVAPAAPPVWPDFSIEDASVELQKLRSAWASYLERADAAELERPFKYVNSKGESWTNRVEDVLNHVLLHSAQHRGQIASCLRDHGHTPAYSDYIHGIRQGLIT